MKLKTVFGLALAAVILTACGTEKVERLRSPCASAPSEKANPCGPKRPVNDWWLNQVTDNV